MVDKDNLKLTTHDDVIVQIARPKQTGRQSGHVLRVVSYNGHSISEPLDKREGSLVLSQILEKNAICLVEQVDERQPDLFSHVANHEET